MLWCINKDQDAKTIRHLFCQLKISGMFGAVRLSRVLGVPSGHHIMIWDTGGSMTPEDEYKKYYAQGEAVYDRS